MPVLSKRTISILFILLCICTILFAQEKSELIQNSENHKRLRFSLLPIFETHVLFNLTAIDESLKAYDFTPIESPLLFSWGIRASFYEKSGFLFGAKVTYGNKSSESPDYDVLTNTGYTKFGYFMGKKLTPQLRVDFESGFAAMTHSVGSYSGGGALVYLGPYFQPSITLFKNKKRWIGELVLGYYLHVPIGSAHENEFWEESFDRTLIHGAVISIASGISN